MSAVEDLDNEGSKSITQAKDPDSPLFISDHYLMSPVPAEYKPLHQEIVAKDGFAIVIPPVRQRWEYREYYEAPFISKVLEEYDHPDVVRFLVKFSDGNESRLTYDQLVESQNGVNSLLAFSKRSLDHRPDNSTPDHPVVRKSTRQTQLRNSSGPQYVDISTVDLSSDDELASAKPSKPIIKPKKTLESIKKANPSGDSLQSESTSDDFSSEDSHAARRGRKAVSSRQTRPRRSTAGGQINYEERLVDDDLESEETDSNRLVLGKRKRGRWRKSISQNNRKFSTGRDREPIEGIRKSSRRGRNLESMYEVGEDDIPKKVLEKSGLKFSGAKENFVKLPTDSDFRHHHCQTCDTCNEYGDSEEKGQLIYCQGCTLAYHQKCLGSRNSRDHLVTKIGDKDFVLQCRRCIGIARKKDPMAPQQGECSICHQQGEACQGFRERKTSRQEQKEREENDGSDPITEVPTSLINNVENILFRCVICYRAFHMYHLPSKADVPSIIEPSKEQMAIDRFSEYSRDWLCKECVTSPKEIESLVAWRPIDQEIYKPGTSTELVNEDAKEYLVRWKNMSYFRTTWMPGAWVWGVTSPTMRKAFARRDNENNLPKMRTEDAIPEDYLRIDIVLDIEYTNVVMVHVEKVDLARIDEVKKALVKFKGLGYEDVVWEEPPAKEDTERWADFKLAYEDWVHGNYVHSPMPQSLASHLSKVRAQNFEKKIMLHTQPETLTGGKLMDYQLEGLNWLYFRWHQRQNAILADEMGLGKTIQIIGFLLTLQQRHKCWPFLVVVPNSTCPNWRREIKQWAPPLRVVAYYGSSEARKLVERHELYPGGRKDLRCHVVVTSYEAAQHEDFRKIFRGVSWAGLIVDEGQRLKNDKNILYEALNDLKAPFKVLLTGTPLQNNPRELFNLLQFLDKSFDAEAMEIEYATLTKENVPQLHELLRTLLLRRTKAQVLNFLPSMAQIIVPVTMSVVQKKLYKSILAKNSELIKSVFGGSQRLTKQSDRANLNNILMQLRKCLCHPFVYSRAIEERSSNAVISHRNLVDASSKLQLLEVMLPKLEERGHRVLIFSQFLDMLDMIEDFLDGLGLYYQRLDGTVSSLQKQKRIDEFNAPNSPLFAFLLSTRAGGVGINLATADTVIILDPDFNPHQDIQALSRAHRIGQQKKVLVFQLMTRNTAEEKIMQIGKKKMALDHALIEQMGAAEDDAGIDLESILRHGAEALFKDDDTHDIQYDSSSIEKLLDRSQIENTQTGKDSSAESQFSFARVWANDKSSLEDAIEEISEDDTRNADPSIWENILKTREQEVAEEAAAKAEMLGRGKRKRQTVDYSKQSSRDLGADSPVGNSGAQDFDESGSDTDFQAREAESDGEESGNDAGQGITPEELEPRSQSRRRSGIQKLQESPEQTGSRDFKRAELRVIPFGTLVPAEAEPTNSITPCFVCNGWHEPGYCPIKLAGVEYCGLCGIAHYGAGHSKNCPHLNSVTQCRAMLDTLKSSTEPRAHIEQAKKYLVGVVGGLNRKKKLKETNAIQPSHVSDPPFPTNGESFGLNNVNGPVPTAHYVKGPDLGKENGHDMFVAPSTMFGKWRVDVHSRAEKADPITTGCH